MCTHNSLNAQNPYNLIKAVKKSAMEDGINHVSYFMSSMALDAKARLKVIEIVPRVGLHGILMR